MTPTRLKFIITAIVFSITILGQCAAGVIAYSNLRASPSYGSFGIPQGTFFGTERFLAQRFTANTGGRVSKIELGMRFIDSSLGIEYAQNVDYLTLNLVPDVNGKLGTQVLWSQSYTDHVPNVYGKVASFDVTAGPTLEDGRKYWLTSSSAPIGRYPHAWFFAIPPAHEPSAFREQYNNVPVTAPWIVSSDSSERALRVTVIPEPAAAALMLAASATLLAVRRRTSP